MYLLIPDYIVYTVAIIVIIVAALMLTSFKWRPKMDGYFAQRRHNRRERNRQNRLHLVR